MKFEIEKNILFKNLDDVNRAIDSSNIYIHLRNFYVNVLDESIIIKGSNGYFSIEAKIELSENLKIEKIGKFLIPSTLFLNIIKKCEGMINLEAKNEILYIKNNSDNYEINLLSIDDYPTIDFSLYGNKIKVNAEKLKNAINNVIFASSSTSEEMILSGINIRYENNKLSLTATDGFRLATETIDIQDDRNISFDITVMNKNIKSFIPSDVKDDVIFYANEQKINLIHNNTNYQSKIIEAPYKNVSSLFNHQFSKKLIIDKNIFSSAINKVSVISSEAYNSVFISINKDKITLSTQASEIGSSSVVISNINYTYTGDDIEIVLNYRFLKEAISVFNDKIIINLENSRGLVMIESEKINNKQLISPIAK